MRWQSRGSLFHKPLHHVTPQHVIKSRTAGGADNYGVDVEFFRGVGNGFRCVVRYRPDWDYLDLFFPHGLKHRF